MGGVGPWKEEGQRDEEGEEKGQREEIEVYIVKQHTKSVGGGGPHLVPYCVPLFTGRGWLTPGNTVAPLGSHHQLAV